MRKMGVPRGAIALAACAAAAFEFLAPAVHAVPRPESDTPLGYVYFKEPQVLDQDVSRIAVLGGSSTVADGRDGLRESGAAIDAESATAWPIPGWTIVSTLPQARSARQVRASVERLAAMPQVGFVSPVFRGAHGGPIIPTSTVLVRFRSSVTARQVESILAECKAGTIVKSDWANLQGAYKIQTAARDGYAVLDIANALAGRDEVIFAEPSFIFTGRGELIPNDTLFGDQWGLHNTGQMGGTPGMDMDAPGAWDITLGDPSIKVVIIDTGIEQTHPDINQLPGMDLTTNPDTPGGGPANDCDNHGTELAGSVSGIINNALGITGIAPNCKVVSARTFISLESCDGSITGVSGTTVEALAYAESIGAKVTNNSNSYEPIRSAAIDSKYAETRAKGMVHFASAGFGNNPVAAYPAWLPSVNTIAGVQRNGIRSALTNYGPDLFLVAPGEDILTTDRTGAAGNASGDYTSMTGSSLATSYTAGVAALVLSMNPARPAWAVEQILKSTAVDLGPPGFDIEYGWGMVNAHAAVVAAAVACNDPGTPDCNGNGVVDSCDLFDGTSADCNNDGIPDECQSAADCQNNGMVDICEIGLGLAKDCNRNSVPDECDLSTLASADCNANGVPDECDNAAPATIVSDRAAVHGFTEISATGTPLGLADDTVAVVTMPFVPPGFSRSDLVVSNDGGISLDGRTTLLNPNQSLPALNAFARGEALLVYWDDLDRTTGDVYYATIGSLPNRTFIIEWSNRPHNPGDTVLDGDEATFQVQIFETPNDDIVAQYLYADTDFLNASTNDGQSATIGYQRSATEMVQWSFNTAGAVSAGTLLSLVDGDTNQNGRPDVCDPAPPRAVAGLNKPRALSVASPAVAAGEQNALRVALLDLQNPVPANAPCCPPPNFSGFEFGATCGEPGGCVRWIGPPHDFAESQDNPGLGSYRAARLQCTPFYHDWSIEAPFVISGAELLPSSRYAVQTVAFSCLGNEAACLDTSAPLSIVTTRWGDFASPLGGPTGGSQPDSLDVLSLINKYKNLPGALSKASAQLQPNAPELNADISALDITACIDAFKGLAYPYSGPCACPSTVTCGATPCSTPASCAGGTCVRVCAGGASGGEPCLSDAHCPGGTCGSGSCRDRCGRCTP